jgi:hemerythrin
MSITFCTYLLLGDLFVSVWPKIAKLGEGWRLAFEILFGLHLILVTSRLTAVFDPSPLNFWMESESSSSISLLLSLVTFSLWAIGIVVLDTFQVILKLNAKNSVLSDLAMKDALTGIPNRLMMDIELNNFMALAKRFNTSISFIIADIDFFKKVNDDYGHDLGDEVLIQTASIIKDVIRSTDRLYRWGGEEFLIVTPHTDLEGARTLAEKIRLKYQEATFKSVGKLTISFGVAEYYPDESRELWFKRADIALYHAKSGGRNRVEIWKPTGALEAEFTKIQWQDRWNSGNPTIDLRHQELIGMTNVFFDMVSKATHPHEIREHFTKIITHLELHFREEEKELEAVDYDCFQQHQTIHRRLLSELSTMQENIDSEKLDYRTYFVFLVGKVVIGHLLTEDTKFFPLFQEGSS